MNMAQYVGERFTLPREQMGEKPQGWWIITEVKYKFVNCQMCRPSWDKQIVSTE